MSNTSNPIGPVKGVSGNSVDLVYQETKVGDAAKGGSEDSKTALAVTAQRAAVGGSGAGSGDAGPINNGSAAGVTQAEALAMQLNPQQRLAIVRLSSGSTRAEAAVAAGVTRTTLYRWLNHDPAFQAVYNAWHRDLISTAQSQLLAASQDAIACVVDSVRRGNSQLAWKLLTSLGLTQLAKPGSTDVAFLQRQEELNRKRQEIAQRNEQSQVLMDDLTTLG